MDKPGKLDQNWHNMLARLVDFKKTMGCMPRADGDEGERSLAWWVVTQRKNARQGKLAPERHEAMALAGVAPAASRSDVSTSNLDQLGDYIRANGSLAGLSQANQSLYHWLCVRKYHLEAGNIDENEHKALVDMGVDMAIGPRQVDWNHRFEEFKAAAAIQGPADIYMQRHAGERVLVWVRRQREAKETMPTEQRHLLDAAGFLWESRQTAQRNKPGMGSRSDPSDSTALWTWRRRLEQATAFKATHGHLDVDINQDPALARWMDDIFHNSHKLPLERQRELEAAGLTGDNAPGHVMRRHLVPHDAARDAAVTQHRAGLRAGHKAALQPPSSPSLVERILAPYWCRSADPATVYAFLAGLNTTQSTRTSLWVADSSGYQRKALGNTEICTPANLAARLARPGPLPAYLVFYRLGTESMTAALKCLHALSGSHDHAGLPSVILSGGSATIELCARLGLAGLEGVQHEPTPQASGQGVRKPG